VNSSSLHEGLFDIGQDGKTGGSLPIVGRDAYGYMLDYYVGDYKPVGQQAFSLNTFTSPSPTPATGFKSLYNGNIGGMVTNIRQLNTPQYTYYHYDQLNRIKRMEALHGQNAAANTWTFGLRFNGYIESFTYDPNGNIKTLSRNSNVAQIDDLTYNYLAGTNKLTGVTDPIASGLVNYDIDGQSANNYSYDRIGNMTADNAEGITNISWTVYGKIKNITKSTGTIEYRYDASGNRIYKKTFISGATTETYYSRDAQGNVMAVYEKQAANPLKWMEQHLYGSSRLGMWNLADVVPGTTVPASGGTVEDGYLYGSKFFELSNHLGNVLVTVSDKKIGIDDGGNGTTDYFQPEVLTAQDYYSFGMSMPGRKYTKPNSGYRYGFNGKEKDNEVKGEGMQYDYGFRIYDSRLARFMSVDPLMNSYPHYTPYQFSGNNPIKFIDLDGLEEYDPSEYLYADKPKIPMDGAPSNSPTNAQGFPRNARYFWRQMLFNHPQYFSADNAALIKKGLSPWVDEVWVKSFPSDAVYMDNRLIHHHANGGNMAVAIAEKMHWDKFSELHSFLNKAKTTIRGIGVSGTLNGLVNIFGIVNDVSGLIRDNPDALANQFSKGLTTFEENIGRVVNQFFSEGPYLDQFIVINEVVKETTTLYNNKGEVIAKYVSSRFVKAEIFSDYVWDADQKKFRGVNLYGTQVAVYNYDKDGNIVSSVEKRSDMDGPVITSGKPSATDIEKVKGN
jgi:RHS repeat-associated protein